MIWILLASGSYYVVQKALIRETAATRVQEYLDCLQTAGMIIGKYSGVAGSMPSASEVCKDRGQRVGVN